MTIELWEIAIALIFMPLNALIFLSRRGQNGSLAIGARIFAGLSYVVFAIAALAMGSFAQRYYLHPDYFNWPDRWLDLSGPLIMGSTMGAAWLWWISRNPDL